MLTRRDVCREASSADLQFVDDVEANPYHLLPSINQPTVYQAINRYFGLHSSPLVTVNAVVVVIIYLLPAS